MRTWTGLRCVSLGPLVRSPRRPVARCGSASPSSSRSGEKGLAAQRACYPACMNRAIPLLLFGGTAALGLAFRPEHLSAWDPIQMALGLTHFDLALHQPHPPGYLAPMAVAWVLNALGLGLDHAMQVQSILATALAAVALFFLGRSVGTSGEGFFAALLFAVHPVTLYYAVSGETYSAEALFAVLLVSVGLRVERGAPFRRLTAFFVLYGLSGGVRQSLPLFFLPFAVWRLVVACRGREGSLRPIAIAAIACLAGTLSWLVPLLFLAGGPAALLDSFGTQFFRLFGAHYSPLMGASGATVLHNLDLLWRLVVEGLSASGLVAVALLGIGRLKALREDRFWVVLIAWIIPPFLWFGLMFIYKSGHLLFLIPAFALASSRVFLRGIRSRRFSFAVALSVVFTQAGLFLAPPEWWVRSVGGRSWPAIAYAETVTAETLAALRGLADGHPQSVLVFTRDGPLDFRTAMYYLPEMHVVWALDRESTGANREGALLCKAREHVVRCAFGAGFWTGPAWPREAEVRLDAEIRYIAWFWDPTGRFRAEARRNVPVREMSAGRLARLEVTDLSLVPLSEFQIGPYRFVRDPGGGATPKAPR